MINTFIQNSYIIIGFFIISSILLPYYELKKISLILLLFTLFQYITNYAKCGLIELDFLLNGDKYKDGYLYKIIKPLFKPPNDYFEGKYYWYNLLLILILTQQIMFNKKNYLVLSKYLFN